MNFAYQNAIQRGHWLNKNNQRKFLQDLGRKLGINEPKDWGKISTRKVVEYGGVSILNKFGGSLQKALKSNFEEIEWKEEWFTRNPGYWLNKSNQRVFFDSLAKEFNIKEPSDWKQYFPKLLQKKSVRSIISYYRGSLKKALETIYPEFKINNKWNLRQSPSFWISHQNQRNAMSKIAYSLHILKPSDWGNITVRLFLKYGGISILKYYGGSIRKALSSIFPEIEWKEEWFSKTKGYWNMKSNQRKYLNEIALALDIKYPEEWEEVSSEYIVQNGGASLLNIYGNIQSALKAVYPEIEWKDSLLRSPHGYWSDKENQKKFLEMIGSSLGIKKPSDWGKVTIRQVREYGGASLLNIYDASLLRALRNIFPEISWKRSWFLNLSKMPHFYWQSKENEKMFLEEMAIKYNLENPGDWRKATAALIRKCGGQGLLKKYKGSLVAVLKQNYPEKEWSLSPNSSFFKSQNSLHKKLGKLVSK